MSPLRLTAVILTLATVRQGVATDPTCPAGTVRIDAANGQWWCIRKYTPSQKFCNAVKTCHSKGEEMISRPVFDAMKASPAISGTPIWWVGLVDAANERVHSKSGWVWMKEGQVTNGTDGYFESSEPNDRYLQDCVTTSNNVKQLRDEDCENANEFYCYSDPSAKAAPPKTRKFDKVQIKEYEQPDPGCWIKDSSASTLFGCTLACFAFEFDDCVGFYWNTMSKVCVLLPYFDATLPLNSTQLSTNYMEQMHWTKYRRTRESQD